MLNTKNIEYFVYTNTNYLPEKTQDIYGELQKLYKTDMDGLDKVYFDVRGNVIASLDRKEFLRFIKKAKGIIWRDTQGTNVFFMAYFEVLRGLIDDLGSGEYGGLSKVFNENHELRRYLIGEIFELLPFVSVDYGRAGSYIEILSKKQLGNSDLYWREFKKLITPDDLALWVDKAARIKIIQRIDRGWL